MAPLLRIEAISKSFPGVSALQDVSFAVETGSVHAIVGENGAGKSTLMQIIAGVQRPDDGTLFLNDEELRVHTTREAQRKGIGIVCQELNLAPNMTVAENICLGIEPCVRLVPWAGRAFVDRAALRSRAAAVLKRMGVAIGLDTKVGELSIARQQLIEICKALVHAPRLLIFDEPTSSLSETETEVLFKVIADLKADGVTMLYISHRMPEVFSICDAVTVLRDGRHVKTLRLAETSPDEIVRLMVGRDLGAAAWTGRAGDAGPVVLSVRGLTREPYYRDISFDLRAGEIVGLAGLMGAGRSEMALGIFGAPPIDGGDIRIDDRPVRIRSPKDALRRGIAMVPEDRKRQGLFLGLGVGANLSLSASRRFVRWGMINFSVERSLIAGYIQRLRIKTPTAGQAVGLLSGGNQQKVVLAKWLATNPKSLIVDEPTRGVDVGAKAEIYALMRDLADEGLAILMISSDLPEILTVSDRILVMRDGRLVGEMSHAEANEEKIMALAALDRPEAAE
jgi:ribose transport system ATP-binding protein/rhamnose transport system ATP-binding protein